ncbi:hypothetical protein [Clostridium sp. DL1XJH146]
MADLEIRARYGYYGLSEIAEMLSDYEKMVENLEKENTELKEKIKQLEECEIE